MTGTLRCLAEVVGYYLENHQMTGVWNQEMDFEHPERTAQAGIRETEDYFKSLDMPVSLKELGVDPASFKVMVEKCSGGGARRLTGIRELDEEDMIRIYEMAMGE